MRETVPGGTAPSNRALVLGFVAVLVLVYLLRLVLLPVVIAAAIAYVVRPAVGWLQRRLRLPRVAAVLVVYLLVLTILAGAGWALAISLGDAVAQAARELPALISRMAQQLFGPQISVFGRSIEASTLGGQVLEEARTWAAQPGAAWAAGTAVVGAPAIAVLMLVLLFYFINSGRRLAEGALWLAPPPHRGHLRDLARRIDPMLRAYLRGVLLVVLYTAAVAWTVLGLVFKLPLAGLISILVGVLELVPVIGPAVSMALIGLSVLINGGGLWAFAGGIGFAVALRVSIDEIVGPFLLGRAVRLHPVAIILAFLIAGTLYGTLGVLLAVPAAAAGRIVLGVWYGDESEAERDPPERRYSGRS